MYWKLSEVGASTSMSGFVVQLLRAVYKGKVARWSSKGKSCISVFSPQGQESTPTSSTTRVRRVSIMAIFVRSPGFEKLLVGVVVLES